MQNRKKQVFHWKYLLGPAFDKSYFAKFCLFVCVCEWMSVCEVCVYDAFLYCSFSDFYVIAKKTRLHNSRTG